MNGLLNFVIRLLVLAIVIVLCVWIIGLIPFPPGLEVIKTILYVIIALFAVVQLLGSIGVLTEPWPVFRGPTIKR